MEKITRETENFTYEPHIGFLQMSKIFLYTRKLLWPNDYLITIRISLLIKIFIMSMIILFKKRFAFNISGFAREWTCLSEYLKINLRNISTWQFISCVIQFHQNYIIPSSFISTRRNFFRGRGKRGPPSEGEVHQVRARSTNGGLVREGGRRVGVLGEPPPDAGEVFNTLKKQWNIYNFWQF